VNILDSLYSADLPGWVGDNCKEFDLGGIKLSAMVEQENITMPKQCE
jgi:hypothetical protein